MSGVWRAEIQTTTNRRQARVGVYRDIFHRMRYTPAPMIDFIDGDEQSDFLRQEEVCGLDIARQDQRSWN